MKIQTIILAVLMLSIPLYYSSCNGCKCGSSDSPQEMVEKAVDKAQGMMHNENIDKMRKTIDSAKDKYEKIK